MCLPQALLALPGMAAAGGATAAATTAATAGGFAATMAKLGTVVSAAGSVVSGVMGLSEAQNQAAALEDQRRRELAIGAIESSRIRGRYRGQIGQQTNQLAARGIRLDSPSAIYLAEQAAAEMTFDADSAMASRSARGLELSAAARSTRARGIQGMLRGTFNAGATLLDAAPELWPGLTA